MARCNTAGGHNSISGIGVTFGNKIKTNYIKSHGKFVYFFNTFGITDIRMPRFWIRKEHPFNEGGTKHVALGPENNNRIPVIFGIGITGGS